MAGDNWLRWGTDWWERTRKGISAPIQTDIPDRANRYIIMPVGSANAGGKILMPVGSSHDGEKIKLP